MSHVLHLMVRYPVWSTLEGDQTKGEKEAQIFSSLKQTILKTKLKRNSMKNNT